MTPSRRLDSVALLGIDGTDVGCDVCFDLIDRYVEAEHAGLDVDTTFPGMSEHLRGCPACAEEAVSLLALLAGPPPVRPPGLD